MNGSRQQMLLSHVELRRFVGGIGALFPVLLMVSGFVRGLPIQPSLSQYYSLDGISRDLFVGVLIAIATFFWSYRGYDRRDKWTARVASVCALGVALFPHRGPGVVPLLHFGFAVGLLSALACFALCLFTRSSGDPTPSKRRRNRIYTACGAIIVLSVLLILFVAGVAGRLPWGAALAAWNPILWLECAAVWAFAFAWLVKGEVAFRDAVGPSSRLTA